jgi:hypothetical protein
MKASWGRAISRVALNRVVRNRCVSESDMLFWVVQCPLKH